MIFPLPTTPAQLFFVRVTPVMDVTSAPQLSYSTRGQQRQANKERISNADEGMDARGRATQEQLPS